eukprot:TRINITY_DN1487_c1_g1_i2.p2 TRINITY_DN1487_c1_g1~~TRINITY_DN1487_c1_g1_i2.p2  ORF type:complete len:176 (-),score=6.70 TRINITY_DN1487_c1_g1_i2:429-956(-)
MVQLQQKTLSGVLGVLLQTVPIFATTEQNVWNTSERYSLLIGQDVCSIDRVSIQNFSVQDFEKHILEKQPVVVEGTQNVVFAHMTTKKWILFPPSNQPLFDPDESSLWWLQRYYPSLPDKDRMQMQECIIKPGEILYFPSDWWHATVNIGETVFVSSFASQANAKNVKFNYYGEL